jgi:hypothetical protein
MTPLELALQFIFLVLFIGLLTSFLMWVRRILLESRLMAKIAPYKIKKDTLVIYKGRKFKVKHSNKNNYNIIALDSAE